MVVGFDYISSIVVFLHDTGQLTNGLLAFGRTLQIFLCNDLCNHHAENHKDQKDTGERNAVVKHNCQGADDCTDRYQQLQQTCLKHIRNFVQVAGDVAQNLTRFVLVKKSQGQPVQLMGDLGSQLQVQVFRHICHQVRLQVVKNPGKKVLNGQLSQFTSHIRPGNGKRRTVIPCCLYALPEVVDYQRTVHWIVDAETNIDDNRNCNNSEPDMLTFNLAEQPCYCPLAVLFFYCLVHASCASFVCDS